MCQLLQIPALLKHDNTQKDYLFSYFNGIQARIKKTNLKTQLNKKNILL